MHTAMDLSPHFENFSRSFCPEKDIMNHEFRTFVTAYALALSRSDYREISILSTLISHLGDHTLRILNRDTTLLPCLPQPKLYSFQVRSEIRYQAQRFVKASLAALHQIDVSFSGIRHVYDSHGRY